LTVRIDHVVTHGKSGAVNGRVQRRDGTVYEFADVYAFATAKGTSVCEITSFMIECVHGSGDSEH